MVWDWASRIEDACDQLGIDLTTYHEDDGAKETVARILGFTSFASFMVLPRPDDVIEGAANPILPEHKIHEAALGEECSRRIVNEYVRSLDQDNLDRQVIRLVKYIQENFEPESTVVTLMALSAALGEHFHPERHGLDVQDSIALTILKEETDKYKTIIA